MFCQVKQNVLHMVASKLTGFIQVKNIQKDQINLTTLLYFTSLSLSRFLSRIARTTELLFYLTHGNVHLAFLRSLCKKRMTSTVPGFNLLHLDSSTRPAELNVRSLDALVAGNGIQSCLALSWRVTWRQRFGDIKQVTLLRRPSYCNLIKEPNKIWK